MKTSLPVTPNEMSNKQAHCIATPSGFEELVMLLVMLFEHTRDYLINTSTHCRTPAVPVQAEGPSGTSASCINKPTDAANETNDTTYARKSQSFNLQYYIPRM